MKSESGFSLADLGLSSWTTSKNRTESCLLSIMISREGRAPCETSGVHRCPWQTELIPTSDKAYLVAGICKGPKIGARWLGLAASSVPPLFDMLYDKMGKTIGAND